jgi:RNA polymerase sigma-70 factor, ECF subfamily
MNQLDFPEAYARFWGPIRAKCRRMLGATALADEVAQEAFLRLWQSGPPLDGSSEARRVLGWLYLTSTRLSLDALRRARGQVLIESEDALSCAASPLAVVEARSAIGRLSERASSEELEAALLARVDGLSQPEVAALLGVSERTVRRWLEAFDGHVAALREELS